MSPQTWENHYQTPADTPTDKMIILFMVELLPVARICLKLQEFGIFKSRVFQPLDSGNDETWGFPILPGCNP